ncbi:hypothetical protein MdSGHV006 [Musca domestica salivary gland hypertrophy virus]|uniref:Uncharacterized protein n=1 Tax=Musca hytrovirus(isolate Musca domestica/United States/Boucias/-) TaxID=523909 RepID=B2YFY3_MHVB|nr:hypothetical protein MdSGHV006 [Musca domestica salivary gland hypertrophy virus]ACD03465.1 hypothetical protein MdSGHV006 [Musca domestica salivary gland hypertrophy virus]
MSTWHTFSQWRTDRQRPCQGQTTYDRHPTPKHNSSMPKSDRHSRHWRPDDVILPTLFKFNFSIHIIFIHFYS